MFDHKPAHTLAKKLFPMNRDFLKAGNPNKISNVYSHFLSPAEIAKIRSQSLLHVVAMYNLGVSHYRFAISLQRPHWRQRVSRLYYATYNISKSVRFECEGTHSTDVKDHSKVGSLPATFPNRATYENELSTLRDDRNSCDYDHMIRASDLVNNTTHYSNLALSFIRDAHDYLKNRGVALGKKL